MKKWKVLNSHYAFDNPWMKIRQDSVELANGKVLDDYFVYEEGDVVMVVPILMNGKCMLVQQYKHAAQDIMIEFPAGFVNKNESILDAAVRELKEETGLRSDKLELLTTITNNPTKVVGDVHIFIALETVRSYSDKDHQDDTEEIQTLELSFSEILELIKKGEIRVSSSIIAFYSAVDALGKMSLTS